jgi:hypothetical protein
MALEQGARLYSQGPFVQQWWATFRERYDMAYVALTDEMVAEINAKRQARAT